MQKVKKILQSIPKKKVKTLISGLNLGKFGPFCTNKTFYKNLDFVSHLLLLRLSFIQKIRKILRIFPEKKAKLSILGPNLGQFGLFWPNKNFLKNLGLLDHWPLWKISFMQKIRKILCTVLEKITRTEGRTDGRTDGGNFIGHYR